MLTTVVNVCLHLEVSLGENDGVVSVTLVFSDCRMNVNQSDIKTSKNQPVLTTVPQQTNRLENMNSYIHNFILV